MAEKKKKPSSGSGIWNIGEALFKAKKEQMEDVSEGKQPKTISSNPAEVRDRIKSRNDDQKPRSEELIRKQKKQREKDD